MASVLTTDQLTGREESHLGGRVGDHRLQVEAAQAFEALQADARQAGYELAIASGFRSYARQLAIWNGKALGQRPVHDDRGRELSIGALRPRERLHAILRYSAIPGTSRHHWGTDLDVYDAAAVPADYAVQLTPGEVAPGGPFDPLHRWLDERMSAGQSQGFYRPYAQDRGGVAPERWHLSYAPLAIVCESRVDAPMLVSCWGREECGDALLLRAEIEAELPSIISRYIAVPGDWCGSSW